MKKIILIMCFILFSNLAKADITTTVYSSIEEAQNSGNPLLNNLIPAEDGDVNYKITANQAVFVTNVNGQIILYVEDTGFSGDLYDTLLNPPENIGETAIDADGNEYSTGYTDLDPADDVPANFEELIEALNDVVMQAQVLQELEDSLPEPTYGTSQDDLDEALNAASEAYDAVLAQPGHTLEEAEQAAEEAYNNTLEEPTTYEQVLYYLEENDQDNIEENVDYTDNGDGTGTLNCSCPLDGKQIDSDTVDQLLDESIIILAVEEKANNNNKKSKSKVDKLMDKAVEQWKKINSPGDINRIIDKYGDVYVTIRIGDSPVYIQHKNEHGKEYTGVLIKSTIDINCIIFKLCRR